MSTSLHKPRQASARQRTEPSMEDIVEILSQRIVNHEIPPGSKLREAVLTEEFKVSRPRIREAFGVLEDRGLIERIPNRGAVVTRLDEDEVLALFDVREVLEALAVRLATEKTAPEAWDDLIARFGKPTEEAVAQNDFDFYVESITMFRQRTISAANNPILFAQLDAFFDRTKVFYRRMVLIPGRAAQGLSQHQDVLRAMRNGDAELAEQLKRINIRSSRDSFYAYRKYLL